VSELRVIPLAPVGMVHEGDDLVAMLLDALATSGFELRDRDLVIVTSKSRLEGRGPGRRVRRDRRAQGPPRRAGVGARAATAWTLRITETRHGFVNANAGIDLSNTDDGTAVLLPKDPDRSARRIRAELTHRCGVNVAVVITDTFGRVWRNGVTDVAIGSAGVVPVLDLRGTTDATGRLLEATEVAIVDEIAGAPISSWRRRRAHRSRSCVVWTSASSDLVRSATTSFVLRTTICFVDQTPPRRTSPDNCDAGPHALWPRRHTWHPVRTTHQSARRAR